MTHYPPPPNSDVPRESFYDMVGTESNAQGLVIIFTIASKVALRLISCISYTLAVMVLPITALSNVIFFQVFLGAINLIFE